MDEVPANRTLPEGDLQSEPDYDYIKEIARGGYGYVYLFRRKQPKGGKEANYCAGKFVYRQIFGPPDDAASTAAYQRAFEGLQNFQSISGRSGDLLRILHVRQRHEEGYFCYMMELADDIETGQRVAPDTYQPRTLKRELERDGKRRRLPARKCLDIAISLARGLRVLHENNFVHRDVRPSNIIFVKDVPKLADIDLLAGSDATLTSYIPRAYAAPEGPHTARADIFSFGKTLYEMSTGMSLEEYPKLPPDILNWDDHKVVLKINRVISKACARKLRNRYATAAALLEDLERIRDGKPPKPGPRVILPLTGVLIAGLLVAIVPRFLSHPHQSGSVAPGRSPAASVAPAPQTPQAPRSIDLTPYYNASLTQAWHNPSGEGLMTLRKLPVGIRTLDGTPFNLGGIIQLSSPNFEKAIPKYPQAVKSIKIDQKCQRLHMLHATGWNVPDGTQVGTYILNYADHQQHGFPIIYGEDVRDWNVGSQPKGKLTRAKVVWTAWEKNWKFRLFKTTWENPTPENQVESIDFVTKMTPAAPFLIAITVE
jgi:serine/threonine protein kinase